MKNLILKLDNQQLDVDVNADFPITFDYQLEDNQDFQRKKSSESIGLKIAGTLNNQQILNTFNNTSVEDYTLKKTHKSIRKIVAEANGTEIFVGKAIPKKAIKRNGVPTSFELNCFGNNGDWMLDLKDTTLFELVKHIEIPFTKSYIENSWIFDGRDENLPYVFAPVKYAGWMDPDAENDKNYSLKTMKPSLSIYWILYWGFKSVGYKIKSEFFNTNFFRRKVLPWVYGAFLSSEGTKYEIHKFLAVGANDYSFYGDRSNTEQFCDLHVYDNLGGCYDNNNTVSNGNYTGNNEPVAGHGGGTEMIWKYNPPHYGPIEVNLLLILQYDYKIDLSSTCQLDVSFFKNGNLIQFTNVFVHTAPFAGFTSGQDTANIRLSHIVLPLDIITCVVKVKAYKSKLATIARVTLKVLEFTTESFKIPLGGEISFDSYLSFQKYKFLDLFRGIADLYNISIQTDPVNKVLLIEPTHPFSLDNNLAQKQGGYFNQNFEDWTYKEDISEDSTIELYDDNARQFVFKFKDDTNDGALKIVQDRYKITLASGKYVFSERFKAEKKDFENRFFSPTMHYLVNDFAQITGQAPQMICLVPENISNTSSPEATNTFSPKIAFYKGLMNDVGGWKFDGNEYSYYPYMFAVNYKEGGELDPVLSYTDEKIGTNANSIIAKGLLKRFFWQRLAIMNNGQLLYTQFKINVKDITNWFHREDIIVNGEKWELLNIKSYNFLSDKSTKCTLRKWIPISLNEEKNTYPSEKSVLKNSIAVLNPPIGNNNGNEIDKVFDTQYNRLLCLYTDIPKPE